MVIGIGRNRAFFLANLIFLALSARAQTTWTGATDTNFLNAANWSPGLPNATTDATIPSTSGSGVVLSGGSANTQNLTVGLNAGSGVTLSILANSTLTSGTGLIALAASGAPNGAIDVTGSGATWDITSASADALVVGDSATSGPALGALTIDNGGIVSVATSTVVLAESGAVGGVISLNGTVAGRGVLLTSQISVGSGAGGGALDFNGGILRASASQANFLANFATGGVSLGAGGGYIDSNGFAIGISAPISGSGSLTVQGAGTLTLSANNTYAGGTTLSSGTLIVAADASLGAYGAPVAINGGTFTTNANITIDRPVTGSGGTISATNFNMDIGSLGASGVNYSGNVFVGANASITFVSSSLAVVGNVTLAANARVVSINGLSLASAADNLQAATNANSIVQGDFEMNGGTIYGANANGKSLSIEGVLRGAGTVDGNVQAFGVDAGDPGEQTFNPNSSTNYTTKILSANVDIENTTIGTGNTSGYSYYYVNGNISLNPNGGGTLTVTFDDGFTGEAGDSFAIFQSTNNKITGDFDFFDYSNATLSDNLAWNFAPSTGILSIVAVPEPAAYALIFGASLLGLVTLRRRKKLAVPI